MDSGDILRIFLSGVGLAIGAAWANWHTKRYGPRARSRWDVPLILAVWIGLPLAIAMAMAFSY